MTDNKKLANRIPFEDIKTMESWKIPNVSGQTISNKKVASKKQTHESIEDVRPEDLKPITAKQLQKVSEDAEREGREKGYQEGLQQGFTEGELKGTKNGELKAYNETKELLDEKIQAFQIMIDALMDPVGMQDGALESTVIDMAVHLAKYLINRELSEDPSSLFHIVEQAINVLPTGAKNIRVYLHADDAELAHEAFEGMGRDWIFHVDTSLSRGGCRVETDQSLVDHSIEHRLQTMLEKVSFQGDLESAEVEAPVDYRPKGQIHDQEADEFEQEQLPDGDDLEQSQNVGEEVDDEG